MFAAAASRRTSLPIVLVALLGVAGSAGAATSGAAAVRLSGPARVAQGGDARIVAHVSSGTRCSLSVRYRSGAQRLGAATATGGRAEFRFKVPLRAATGPARATASCGRAGSASRSFMVIGTVLPPQLVVVKQGYSHRPHRHSGSTVSWGVILGNRAARDAVEVTVLANFVLPDNTLIGSMTKRLARVRAGSTHAVGGDLRFPGVPPINRLEVVVQVRKAGPLQRILPAVANAHVVRDHLEPQYVASVEGEVANDHRSVTMRSIELSTVALDADGNVLGGGTGYAFASLPPGARQFFKVSGLTAVDAGRVASVMVSVVPAYDTR